MIPGHNGPVIVHPDHLIGPHIDHGLHCQGHARLQQKSLALHGKIGHLRVLMEMGADAVAHQIPDHTVAKALGVRLDRRRDLSQVAACLRKPDPLKKALLRYIHQLLRFRRYLAYGPGPGCVRMISLIDHAGVQTDDIPLL